MTHSPACSVYIRPDAIYIFTQHVTEFGWGIAGEPLIKLPRETTPLALGEAVMASFAASRHGIPQPRDLKPVTEALLTFAGVRSWKSFTKEASLVLVSQEKDAVALMPTLKNGSGFDHQPDKVVRCALSAQAIGEKIYAVVK